MIIITAMMTAAIMMEIIEVEWRKKASFLLFAFDLVRAEKGGLYLALY